MMIFGLIYDDFWVDLGEILVFVLWFEYFRFVLCLLCIFDFHILAGGICLV